MLGQKKARRRLAELQQRLQELAERRAASPASTHVDASLASHDGVGKPNLVARSRAATQRSGQAKTFARAAHARMIQRQAELVDVRLRAEQAAWRTATALATSAARQPAALPVQRDESSPAPRAA